MNFQKDFDTLFKGITTDYNNQSFRDDAGNIVLADASKGTLLYLKNACYASALWGLYKYQDWIAQQIFPDTAETEYLEHHGWVRGISRTIDETDAAYLGRLLEYIRRPPAGGNKYDYVKWALEVNGVAAAWCIPIPANVPGTVDVVILANVLTTGSEIPSSSARISVNTSVTAGKLVDSAAAFTTPHAVDIGDIVENPLRGTRTTVTAVDSATQLALAADIFKFVGDPYIVHCQTGTNTAVAAGKLVDSNVAHYFLDVVYTVKIGDIVENVTDNTQTTVTAVDSATQLSLAADIFTATGKTYLIRGLVGDVKKYIDPLRPVTASKVNIVAPTTVTQAITMTVTGSNLDNLAIAADIAAYLNAMIPGQTLYRAKLMQIAMDNGADNVAVATPAADVTATSYQMIRPGVISVS